MRRFGRRHALLAATAGIAALGGAAGAEDIDLAQRENVDRIPERIIVTSIRPARAEPSLGGQLIDPALAAEGALPSLGDLLAREGVGVTVSEPQGNPFQPELSYRGYSVSGLLGLPQGLALYQNGARVNEAFGDVVNFDTVPELAISEVAIASGASPLFGLNALGGAVAVTMKSGFTAEGTALEVSGGDFGRGALAAETGANNGRWAAYAAVSAFKEDGWRDHSPSEVVQAYADLALRGELGELGVSLTLADTDLNGNGAAPADLLAADREAVFTYPDNTRNELAFLQARGDLELGPRGRLEGGAYFRRSNQATLNGDETDVDECADAAFEDLLCEEDGEGEPVEDRDGLFIEADDVGEEPFAVFNRSARESDAWGGALQVVHSAHGGSPFEELILGVTLDSSTTDFASGAELGTLTADRTVDPAGIFLGGDEFQTGLEARSLAWGAQVAAAFAFSERLEVTLAGRYIHVDVELDDQLGTDLDGDHEFERFNPAIELAYRGELAGSPFRLFARYGESNRTPSPAELSCADPEEPCRFPNAFVADPPLEQVVARTLELGAAGAAPAGGGTFDWALTGFRASNEDDIVFVSSGPVVGSGYFQNAGETRRQGLEASARWTRGPLALGGSWSAVQATFEDALTLLAEDNPSADGDGEIHVAAGDRIPLIPEHSGRAFVEYTLAERFTFDLSVLAASDRVLRGDEGNDEPTLEGFARLDAGVSADLNKVARVYIRIENLLDREHATFGTFGDVDELFLAEAPDADDPRFLTPAAPRAVYAGLRLRF
jgi:outer membrane receptor protein involved in Fe transport